MKKRRILVVDDDPEIVKLLKSLLHNSGYDILETSTGAEAIQIVEKEVPDLLILDLGLPDMDGLAVCRHIRNWSSLPIIVLSGRTSREDKVRCLDAGVDDYITKPFWNEELTARIRVVFRHCEPPSIIPPNPVINFGNVTLDLVNRRATGDDREIKLTPIEYGLLKELVLNKGKVLTHKYLLNKVWGNEYAQETDYLHVFIRRLRLKLEPEPSNPQYIVSVSGVGYKFVS
jgi:two-component system, OmpR family, KDP operon response regulator KdpE